MSAITSGNQFGVNQVTGALEQYAPPGVIPLGTPVNIGQNQTIAIDGTLAPGMWNVVSGELTATTAVVVQPITG